MDWVRELAEFILIGICIKVTFTPALLVGGFKLFCWLLGCFIVVVYIISLIIQTTLNISIQAYQDIFVTRIQYKLQVIFVPVLIPTVCL